MHLRKWKPLLILVTFLLSFSYSRQAYAQTPTITELSPTSGPVGTLVTIAGSNFGTTQSNSSVSLNGTTAAVTTWSNTSIVAMVPSGATSGSFSVSVNSQLANSGSFTITPLPSGWSDGDIGTVGVAGSATYANGTFTVSGSGQQIGSTSDGMHFAYQPLSGDGSIVARVVSVQGGYTQAGVMIRETLNANAANAFMFYQSSYIYFSDRTSTGANTSSLGDQRESLSYWVKVVRSGSTFSGYVSSDGVNWVQIGTSQTITMAQNVYVGLAVSGNSTSSLETATFDSVSINSTSSPAPAITSVSPQAGVIGSQALISGSGFGAFQGNSSVRINGAPAIINSWSATSISITIPSGAISGPMIVSVAPSMNASNAFIFLIGTQTLPSWLDVDVGSVGMAGSATYTNGTFTVKGSGNGISSTSDQMNFVGQPLLGDGSIVARIVSVQGSGAQAGVMIRETLNANATNAYVFYDSYMYFDYRTSTGSSTGNQGDLGINGLPYWVRLVRAGSTFTAYMSPDGVNWTQLESSETISMAQNVYIGLAVSSNSNSSVATATFDNVSISSAVSPAPVITGLSATTGPIGSQVAIAGSGFGASQNGSVVTLNGASMPVISWTDTAIVITIASGATSGPIVVSVAPSMNDSNYANFEVTTTPLPTQWLDLDVGVTGIAGSATFTGGTFTVNGSGQGISNTSDGIHFVYQPFSGDGSIVARVVTVQGNGTEAGVMIRQALDANSVNASVYFNPYRNFNYRLTTGGSTQSQGNGSNPALPYWIKLVRAGSTFTAFTSANGIYWTQLETSQTITMAQNVYVGLFVSSGSRANLATATFDGVSVNSSVNPSPAITGLSATTGSIGSQVVITGSGFGALEGPSAALLNGLPMTIDSWGATSIVFTIPSGAVSGILLVSVAPTMNDSNAVELTVTSNPLLSPWLDQDIGAVAASGGATYASGAFTVQGSGTGMNGTADGFHFVYQPLPGDGTIVARLASVQGTYVQAGVMIRESLNANAANGYEYENGSHSYITVYYRPSTGASTASPGNSSAINLPYWLKLVRNGNTINAYMSPDGVTWTQVSTSVTVTMAQNVYIGLAVSDEVNSTPSTGTFDNVSVTIGTTPYVTSASPPLGGFGTPVTITGSNFGATQGSSTVSFNGVLATTIASWSDSQIVANVPTGAATGPVNVTVNSIQSISSATFAVINPVIAGLTPSAASVNGLVTISGSGFGENPDVSQVQIDGVTASINSWSDISVQVKVPSGAATGPVTVTEDGVTSNSVQFTLLEPLAVTAISPGSGAVGSSVTISGAGFGSSQSDSAVTFDGIPASVGSWSDTSIVAYVPAGASSGPVTVEVAGTTVDGPAFDVTSTVQLTDSLGHQSTYTSEIAGGKWYVSNAQGSGCSSCTVRGNVQYQFDDLGNILSTTDELGYTTSNTYDSNNNLTSITQPAVGGTNPKTTYTYNGFGEVLTMTDPLGNATTNTYDSNGNLLSVTAPAPNSNTAASVTQFAYNSLGELTQITDPLGRITKMTYTPAGLIASITDPQSNVTSYGYDSRGNRTSVTDAMNNQTTFAYDAGNRLLSITYPDNSTMSFTYDYRGRRIIAKDQNGKTTTYAYDDADRLTSVTDAANNVTQYAYDTENNLLSVTDANSHTTSFTYDAYGRVTETNFPSTHSESYGYDADNNLTSKTDRNGNAIQYVYDALNRLTQKNYPDSTNVEYVYDLVGKIQQVTDPTGTYGFAYDNMGRLIGTMTTYSFLPNTPFTNSYTYDADSNRTGFTAPDGSTNTYSYDTLNRLTGLANSWAGSFGFSYDALSRRTQMTRPNGVSTNYTYDKVSHLLSVLHQLSGGTIDGAVYTLDAAGNRTAKADEHANVTSNYGYDNIYELLSAMQGTNTTESYSYDPVGNRLSSLGVSSYSNNVSNELTSTSAASYTYDSNGNTTSKTDSTGTTNYTWDFENRLTSVTLPGSGGTESYRYDPFGRRIQKAFAQGTNTTTTNYVYDGADTIDEADQNGNTVAKYARTMNIDEPLAESRAGTVSYYQQDGLGTVTSLSNSAGALVQTYIFDSFGKLTASTGSLTNPFRYTGREFDAETNLYYYRARYYDPNLGRFISEDSLGFVATADFYSYVENDALNLADPFGLCPPSDPCAIPKHPPTANVDNNIFLTMSFGPVFWMSMVAYPHASWDYNKQGPYDDFGNFNYGATGAALGIPDQVLLRGAGLYKWTRDTLGGGADPDGSPLGPFPYGNAANKQNWVQKGIDYVKHGCFKGISFLF